MLIPFSVTMSLERFVACRGRVEVARPDRCPACDHHRLTFAGWWPRLTRDGRVDIHRVVCHGCDATHSLWPDVLVAGCGDLAETVGAALEHAATGADHRRVAARVGVAASTVLGWLRRFARRATGLARHFYAVVVSIEPALVLRLPPEPLPAAVAALLEADAALSRADGEPEAPWRLAVFHTRGRLLG